MQQVLKWFIYIERDSEPREGLRAIFSDRLPLTVKDGGWAIHEGYFNRTPVELRGESLGEGL